MKKLLIEENMKKLAENKEYTKVFNYFHDEYTDLLKKFLQRHDVEVNENDCLIDYIVKTRFFMPKYNSYTIPISNAMYNEDLPEAMKYELLMSSYKDVRKAFSK